MNDDVQTSLTLQLAELERVVDPPKPPLGFGRDLSCISDLSPTLVEVDAASPQAICEAIIRRYTTPRGGLADDQDYGLDVRGHINRGVTPRDLRALSGVLRGEAQKDDRVSECDVQLLATLASSSVQIRAVITPADPTLQDFELTFSVTDADVLMVTINA